MTQKRAHEEEAHATFNVGGTVYKVARDTIMKYPDTMLGSMLSNRWEESRDNNGEIFLDRDPILFRYILGFYRNDKIEIPFTICKKEMWREVQYFALPIVEKDIHFEGGDVISLRRMITKFEDDAVERLKKEARSRVLHVPMS